MSEKEQGMGERPIEFAFCERVTATPISPWHIRRVGAEGKKFGGGAPDTVLCGTSLAKGWDLQLVVTPTAVRRLLGADSEPPALCARCADAYLVVLS